MKYLKRKIEFILPRPENIESIVQNSLERLKMGEKISATTKKIENPLTLE